MREQTCITRPLSFELAVLYARRHASDGPWGHTLAHPSSRRTLIAMRYVLRRVVGIVMLVMPLTLLAAWCSQVLHGGQAVCLTLIGSIITIWHVSVCTILVFERDCRYVIARRVHGLRMPVARVYIAEKPTR
jgi:hypothetical protein